MKNAALSSGVVLRDVVIDLTKFGPDAQAVVLDGRVVLSIPATKYPIELVVPTELRQQIGDEACDMVTDRAIRMLVSQQVAAAVVL